MPEPRKTFEIRKFVSRVNGMLSAPSTTTDFRRGVIATTEQVLNESGNYRGFRYVLPGGEQVPTEDVQHGKYDRTRINFIQPKVDA